MTTKEIIKLIITIKDCLSELAATFQANLGGAALLLLLLIAGMMTLILLVGVNK